MVPEREARQRVGAGVAVPLCQENQEPELDLSFSSWILAEIGDLIIPPRQNRSNQASSQETSLEI